MYWSMRVVLAALLLFAQQTGLMGAPAIPTTGS